MYSDFYKEAARVIVNLLIEIGKEKSIRLGDAWKLANIHGLNAEEKIKIVNGSHEIAPSVYIHVMLKFHDAVQTEQKKTNKLAERDEAFISNLIDMAARCDRQRFEFDLDCLACKDSDYLKLVEERLAQSAYTAQYLGGFLVADLSPRVI